MKLSFVEKQEVGSFGEGGKRLYHEVKTSLLKDQKKKDYIYIKDTRRKRIQLYSKARKLCAPVQRLHDNCSITGISVDIDGVDGKEARLRANATISFLTHEK